MTREEAKEVIKAYYDKLTNSVSNQLDEDIKAFEMAIKALEQEPKIGHWIKTNDYLTTAYGSIDYVKCSCCGEDSLEEGDFCPNCGIKMESR